jgi:hypothetical protein
MGVMAVLLAVINVWPLLDLGLEPAVPDHIEVPNGSTALHHSAHDHGLCSLMGSAHVMPVNGPRVDLATRSFRVVPPFVPSGLPTSLAFSTHRSRAPPAV